MRGNGCERRGWMLGNGNASDGARDDAHRRAETDASVGARTNDARTDGATVHVAQPFPSAIREAPPEDA